MPAVYFYRDRSGKEPVKEYMLALAGKNDKDSRIRLKKIGDYIQLLHEHGTTAGEPYMKKIDRECGIWELRPSGDRVLFVAWVGDTFVLLHVFPKKSQKTPRREIERARRELKDLKERGLE